MPEFPGPTPDELNQVRHFREHSPCLTILEMELCSIDWEKLVRVLSALLTPIIAVIATYIAFQQYRVNRRQHLLALFEKRIAVFNSTANFMAAILREGRVAEWEQLFSLLRDTKEHKLLFGPEIGEYIQSVYEKGLRLHTNAAVGGQQSIQQNAEILEWFSGQIGRATEVFLPYLDFRKP